MVSSIEAPLTFLQKPVKILLLDTIKFPQMSLRLIPEILDSVDMIFPLGKQGGVINPSMMKRGNIQRVIALQGVRIHHTIGHHFLMNDGKQGLGFGIRNDTGVDFAFALQKPEYRHFASSASAALPFPHAAKITLVGFHLAR